MSSEKISQHGSDSVLCPPFPVSTDYWSPEVVANVALQLKSQSTPPKQSAALIVGAGGLPYILHDLRVDSIFGVDLNRDVLELTQRRVDTLLLHNSWRDYHDAMRASLPSAIAKDYDNERQEAAGVGLENDYAATRKRAAETKYMPYCGDIRILGSHIGRIAAGMSYEFTFVNFTNISNYLGDQKTQGLAVTATVLKNLPVARDAMIVDSSERLEVQPYTYEQYIAL